MSVVYTVTIISGDYCNGDEPIKKLNQWVKENNHAGGLFEKLKEGGAGTKYPERDIYIGGFNYLNCEEFTTFFRSLQWDNTVLIIGMPEDDDGFRIIPSNGQYGDCTVKLGVSNNE